jgi:hypothetical protein
MKDKESSRMFKYICTFYLLFKEKLAKHQVYVCENRIEKWQPIVFWPNRNSRQLNLVQDILMFLLLTKVLLYFVYLANIVNTSNIKPYRNGVLPNVEDHMIVLWGKPLFFNVLREWVVSFLESFFLVWTKA